LPSCLYGIKEYAKDFARLKDKVYEEKALALIGKLYEPAQFIMEVIGADKLKKPSRSSGKRSPSISPAMRSWARR